MAQGKLKMVEKNGEKVPFYAADGKGKMKKGGSVKKYASGGMTRASMGERGGRGRNPTNDRRIQFDDIPDVPSMPDTGEDGGGPDIDMGTGTPKRRGRVKGYKSGCSVKSKGYKSGGKVRGCGLARGGRPCKMVKMKGA